ncbi:MAG TPA: hypothetical protein PKJ43_06495 [Prolixibacteraceae bacterium]|nr:hypothetical protein [Prolixibacteraceae bacterium]
MGRSLAWSMGRNNNSGMTATSFPNSVAVGSSWGPELPVFHLAPDG